MGKVFHQHLQDRLFKLKQRDRDLHQGIVQFSLKNHVPTPVHKSRAQHRLLERVKQLNRLDRQKHVAVVQYDAMGEHVPELKPKMNKLNNVNLHFEVNPFQFEHTHIAPPRKKAPSKNTGWCPCSWCVKRRTQ